MKKFDIFRELTLSPASVPMPYQHKTVLYVSWKDQGPGRWSNSSSNWKDSNGWSNSSRNWKDEGFGRWSNSSRNWKDSGGWSNSSRNWKDSGGWSNSGGK